MLDSNLNLNLNLHLTIHLEPKACFPGVCARVRPAGPAALERGAAASRPGAGGASP